MQLKTYNELLTDLCDNFDSLISPRSIQRSNTNILYLVLKAFAKGMEVINNTCVALYSKFDPATCDDEDLDALAEIVGTDRLEGSKTGLKIEITNEDTFAHTLYAGTYTYQLDDDTSFSFTLDDDVTVAATDFVSYVAESNTVGQFAVTEQADITVTFEPSLADSTETLDSNFSFMNYDNSLLLGTTAETDLEFRNRIITDTDRQNIISEIETKIKNLPYVFDCDIVFNPYSTSYTYDTDYVVPPYHMLVFVSACNFKPEIAEIIADYGIYPTVNVDSLETAYNSTLLEYKNDVFAGGSYPVYVTPYRQFTYGCKIQYYIESQYASDDSIKKTIRDTLKLKLNSNVHKDYITSSDLYDAIASVTLDGVRILSAVLRYNNEDTKYLSVPKTSIPYLDVDKNDISNVAS